MNGQASKRIDDVDHDKSEALYNKITAIVDRAIEDDGIGGLEIAMAVATVVAAMCNAQQAPILALSEFFHQTALMVVAQSAGCKGGCEGCDCDKQDAHS